MIDPLFPPTETNIAKKILLNDIFPEIKYILIFDEKIDNNILYDKLANNELKVV